MLFVFHPLAKEILVPQTKSKQPTNSRFTYDPRYCCTHSWASCKDKAGAPTGQEFCQNCGAVATFENGRIVEYDATVDYRKKTRA